MFFSKHSEQFAVSSPGQEHFQANITIITYSKYDVIYTTAIARRLQANLFFRL
jgi:hypothetical protein